MGHLSRMGHYHRLPILCCDAIRLHDDWCYRSHSILYKGQVVHPIDEQPTDWIDLPVAAFLLSTLGRFHSSPSEAASHSIVIVGLHHESVLSPYHKP